MAKCEAIDLTLSDSDSDGDFIQAKKAIHPFLYQASVYYMIQVSVHQVSVYTSSSCYNGNYFMGLVRVKRFTGSSGKTSLDLNFIQG